MIGANRFRHGIHCVESVQIRSIYGPYFPVFGPEITQCLDTFRTVIFCDERTFGFVAINRI